MSTEVKELEVMEPQAEAQMEEVIVPEKVEPKEFEFGDFVMVCKCGYKTTLEKGVQYGKQLIIPTTNTHSLDVFCPQCESHIRFGFVEGEAPIDVEIENSIAESIANEIREEANEVTEDSTKA